MKKSADQPRNQETFMMFALGNHDPVRSVDELDIQEVRAIRKVIDAELLHREVPDISASLSCHLEKVGTFVESPIITGYAEEIRIALKDGKVLRTQLFVSGVNPASGVGELFRTLVDADICVTRATAGGDS